VEVVTLLVSAAAQVDFQYDEVSCGWFLLDPRVDLSSSVWMDSSPSCLLSRSYGGGDSALVCWSSSECSRLGELWF
jgi:hypothetical protein